MKEALRSHEVRALTGIKTLTHIYAAIRTSGFPRATVKVSRERLWRREEVEAWMAQRM